MFDPTRAIIHALNFTYVLILLQRKKKGIARNGWTNVTPNPGLLSLESTLANVASGLLQRAGRLAAKLRRSGSQTQL